jgi:HD-like signal output (HDOD) protein
MGVVDIQALIRSTQQIEPLPSSVTRLAALTSGEHLDLREIERVVGLDQALTLRLLQAANSAASASAMRIGAIREAVTRVGVRRLVSLAAAAGVQKRMGRAVPEYGLSQGALWRHSIAAALAAECAQAFCETPLPPETHVAALLHDVGKLAMAQFLDADVLRLLGAAREQGGLSSLRAESELLLVHHGELGGLIAQHWNLPPRLVTGIIHHHTPDAAGDIIADAVHVANLVAKRAGTGYSATEQDHQVNPASLSRLGLTATTFDALCAQVSSRLEPMLAMYAG